MYNFSVWNAIWGKFKAQSFTSKIFPLAHDRIFGKVEPTASVFPNFPQFTPNHVLFRPFTAENVDTHALTWCYALKTKCPCGLLTGFCSAPDRYLLRYYVFIPCYALRTIHKPHRNSQSRHGPKYIKSKSSWSLKDVIDYYSFMHSNFEKKACNSWSLHVRQSGVPQNQPRSQQQAVKRAARNDFVELDE